MCDYSLMGVPNRLARCEEDLVVHRFHTGTMGLASWSDWQPTTNVKTETFWEKVEHHFAVFQGRPACAVCIPPGAQLLLQGIPPRAQAEFGVGSTEVVKFTQLGAETYSHRDAVTFSNGRTLLLQHLQEGQRVRVLALSTEDAVTPRRETYQEVRVR
jgi:hypothetical protein